MALIRIGVGQYASPNFRMDGRKRRNGRFAYMVTPTTAAAHTLLPEPTPLLHVTEARRRIHLYERQLAHLAQPRNTAPARSPAITTGTALADLREWLHPGEGAMLARRRMAASLGISPGHIRHLESGNRAIPPWLAKQLQHYIRSVRLHTHQAVAHEANTLAPFVLLSEALTSDEETSPPSQEQE